MKKLLTLLMSLVIVFSLAACGGPDKQPLIDAFNTASDSYDEVAAIVNANSDSIDEATIQSLTATADKLTEYKTMAGGDEKLTQEQIDEAISYLKTVPDAMKDMKATVEQSISGGASSDTEDTAADTEDAAADTEGTTFTLDYDTIASWVDSGFIGNDESGAPVVMAIDANNENAIIIFGDNTDMTAASFVGPVTYDDETGTIVDQANNTSLTFGVKQTAEDTIELDMGDIGKATIKAAEKDALLETIKNALENYTHVL